jgi:hypothetical protein
MVVEANFHKCPSVPRWRLNRGHPGGSLGVVRFSRASNCVWATARRVDTRTVVRFHWCRKDARSKGEYRHRRYTGFRSAVCESPHGHCCALSKSCGIKCIRSLGSQATSKKNIIRTLRRRAKSRARRSGGQWHGSAIGGRFVLPRIGPGKIQSFPLPHNFQDRKRYVNHENDFLT